MKKKFLCVALLTSFMNINAFAADVSMVGNKVTVEIDSEKEIWSTLIVTKSGKSLDDENIIAMKQALADDNGRAVFNFVMPGELDGGVNGKYDLHITNDGGESYVESMYYVLPADRDKVIGELKNGSDIRSVIENESNKDVLSALGVYVGIYNEFKEEDVNNGDTGLTDSVCKAFAELRNKDMSDSEIISLLNHTLIIRKINVSSDKDADIIGKFGFSFENVRYTDADDETKNFVCDYIYANRPYADVSEVKEAYETANMLNVINNTRFDELESKIKGYASALGIKSDSVYTKYINSSNKTAINEDIAYSLKYNEALSVSDLIDVMEKAIKDNPKKETTGGGGGGGGSKGSGGTMNAPANPLNTIPTVSHTVSFGDIDGVEWAEEAIYAMAKKGIVAGDESGNFNPDNFVKREEFVKMLVIAADVYDDAAECVLGDVDVNAWYYPYVASAYNSKIVNGISENTFGIGECITRQDMAVMCYRVAKNADKLNKIRDSITFADDAGISDYAKEAVASLYESGGINGVGDNLFNPTGTATRAQAAVMIYNLFVK